MSLYAINRSTKTHKGGGIPFYDDLEYVFSKFNADFNSSTGLLYTPTDKLITFQLFQTFGGGITSFVYHETRGENDFTGTTFTPPVFGGMVSTPMLINGVQEYCFELYQPGNLISPAPVGRWVAFLIINNGLTERTLYSEEFLTVDCCQ